MLSRRRRNAIAIWIVLSVVWLGIQTFVTNDDPEGGWIPFEMVVMVLLMTIGVGAWWIAERNTGTHESGTDISGVMPSQFSPPLQEHQPVSFRWWLLSFLLFLALSLLVNWLRWTYLPTMQSFWFDVLAGAIVFSPLSVAALTWARGRPRWGRKSGADTD